MTGTVVKDILDVKPDMIIQEFGWDEDVDEPLRRAIEDVCGNPLEDEDFQEVADEAIVWWRLDDGDSDDLSDELMDVIACLDDGGKIWVFIPKTSHDNAVPLRDVEEAAKTVGLHATTSEVVAPDWLGVCMVSRSR